MSIYGKRVTALGPLGVPAKPESKEATRLMINIELPLQLAGTLINEFSDPTTVPPSQIAQEGDGDIQVVIEVVDDNSVAVDISDANALVLLMQKPSGTTESKTATLINNGRDGKMGYALNASDLNESGYYQFQGSFAIAGVPKSTVIGKINVAENIVIVPVVP